jgi:cellulose synthase/poly-beta-1,6-N-acetylglucosamine synthase-like glycosyltransferase
VRAARREALHAHPSRGLQPQRRSVPRRHEHIGGHYPVHVGEDLLLAYVFAEHGMRGVYCPEALAYGLAPSSWQGYLKQQDRWAYSGVNIKWTRYIASQKAMPWRGKLTLLAHGLFYFLQVLHPIGLALLCVLLVRGGAPAIGATFVALVLAVTALGIAMSLWLQKFHVLASQRGLFWRAQLLGVARWPTLVRAFVAGLGRRSRAFVVTRKSDGAERKAWPFTIHVATCLAIVGCAAVSMYRGLPHQALLYVFAGLDVASVVVLLACFDREEGSR